MKPSLNNVFRIGLTGGIASGKSSVASCFSEYGITIISADNIARDLLLKGSETLAQVVKAFGSNIINQEGELDRRKLRELIFDDVTARKSLDAITHPAIGQELLQLANKAQSKYVLLEIPLLVEAQMTDIVDRILVVDINQSLQINRIMQRDDCSREQALSVIKAQISSEKRLDVAHDIIRNNGVKAKLKHQVALLNNKYVKLAQKSADQNADDVHTQDAQILGLDLH